MLSKLFQFFLASIAILTMLVLFNFATKVPLSGMTASIIDAVPGVDLADSPPTEESAIEEPTPNSSDSTGGESTTEVLPESSIFTGILDTVSESVQSFIESDPIIVKSDPTPEAVSETFQETFQKPLISPKGTSPQLKVFVVTQDTLQSVVNDWLASQKNIVVDNIKVDPYEGGAYIVVMNYHAGGNGNTSTHVKLFAGENPEADANTFLSSLDPSQTVRSTAVVAGSYSGSQKTGTIPLIFVVYE